MSTGVITGIFVYPIKSCAPVAASKVWCTPAGLENDRLWAIVDQHGKLLTQRDDPRLALIQPEKVLAHVSQEASTAGLGSVSKWGEEVASRDAGDGVAEWLSNELGYPCRLMRVADDSESRFVDCCPVSVVAEETVAALNKQLAEPVEMDCFRPSIIVRGMAPFEENDAPALSIGSLTMRSVKPVGRCVVINVNQKTGVCHPAEPLRTLREYRFVNGKAVLGHYFAPTNSRFVSVGAGVDW